jgi:hypothetical protein
VSSLRSSLSAIQKTGAIVAKHISRNKGPDVALMIEHDAPFQSAGVEHSSQRAAPGRRLGDPAQLDFGLNALLSKRSGALQAALGHSASARSPPHFERTRQGNNIDTIRLETISAAMFHKDALPDWMRNEATGQLDCVI